MPPLSRPPSIIWDNIALLTQPQAATRERFLYSPAYKQPDWASFRRFSHQSLYYTNCKRPSSKADAKAFIPSFLVALKNFRYVAMAHIAVVISFAVLFRCFFKACPCYSNGLAFKCQTATQRGHLQEGSINITKHSKLIPQRIRIPSLQWRSKSCVFSTRNLYYYTI